jgi:glycosyltransferase involved in cell wall biosynthesis
MVARQGSESAVCSVVCLTYNHEAYIASALEGFLMQQTSFPIEILVHDDASTDKTATIIRRYEAEYPGRFVCEYEAENAYSKQGHTVLNDFLTRRASGRYIALCEGDDYWTDAKKLEKQVSFMERNPDCAMSFHAARIDYADGSKPTREHRYPGRTFFSPAEVITGGGGFFMSCTVIVRRDVFDDYPSCLRLCPVGDIGLALNAVRKGKIGYLDELMAVYRCGVPGSFTQRSGRRTPDESLEFYQQLADAEVEFDAFTGHRFSEWITRHLSRNAALTLASGAGEPGRYRRYRVMQAAMLPRHRWLFHLGFVYFRLKRLVQRRPGGWPAPSGGTGSPGGHPRRGW